jgi:iron complex outermembrane receptor protein
VLTTKQETNMKKLLFLIVIFAGFSAFSQGTVTGTVMDSELGAGLPSANVMEIGTSNGTISDFDGNFSLPVSSNSGKVEITYVGFLKKTVKYTLTNGTVNLGSIKLAADENTLDEVVIIGGGVIDLASDRRTPVAVSTIRSQEIQERVVGNVELAEALKNTPSAYISGQTGFGDGQLFLRGFDNSNIAVLLNGQPVNSQEDGRIFWSNWSGLADIANTIQVQRGLGSSKLAISSIGGTTNIVMKAADRKKGGFARFLGANDSYFKGTVGYDTGVNEKGWAFSVLLDHWQAHRKWARGTYGEGQNYFFAVGYKPNETHAFNFLVTGAPQLHGQRFSQSRERIAADPKFNEHWGYTEDGIESERQNYYHKPVMNLNWDWTMSDKTDLSTVAYASWGRGGGTGPRGDRATRTEDPDGAGPLIGQIDYPASIANNIEIGLGDNAAERGEQGYIRRASVNNHQWFGLISNLGHEFSDNLSVNFGVDLRTYTGDHFRQVVDLYGLSGWANDTANGSTVTNTFDANPWAALSNFADVEDRIDYDYSEDISYQGAFGQIEYATDRFSVFFQGAFSNQSYQREGRFDDPGTSEKFNKTGYNLKGGVSYSINEMNTIFVNAGRYSRQPFLDNAFQNIRGSNLLVMPEVENEEITGYEAGYRFDADNIRINFNAYVTDWDNRTILSGGIDDPDGTPDTGDETEINIFERGVRQYHTGAEVDLEWRTTEWLTLKGYASGGSWVFKGETNFQVYNDQTNELIREGEGVDRSGIKVSTAPQTAVGLGFRAKVIEGLSFDGNWNYYANHYEFTDLNSTTEDLAKLDAYDLVDLGVSYRFDFGGQRLVLRGNVFNAFDTIVIQQTDRFGFINTNGLTYNGSIRYEF